uniref:Uncharacterized protein n=1 Tax=Cannabis sativa TaxID=3483 RepID=A0A803P4R1_CANSA
MVQLKGVLYNLISGAGKYYVKSTVKAEKTASPTCSHRDGFDGADKTSGWQSSPCQKPFKSQPIRRVIIAKSVLSFGPPEISKCDKLNRITRLYNHLSSMQCYTSCIGLTGSDSLPFAWLKSNHLLLSLTLHQHQGKGTQSNMALVQCLLYHQPCFVDSFGINLVTIATAGRPPKEARAQFLM